MFLLLKLAVLVVLAYAFLNLYLYYKRSKYRDFPSPPIPLTWTWFMGHLPDLKERKVKFPNKSFVQLTAEYHKEYHWDMVRLSFFNQNFVFCVDLPVVKKILTDEVNFPKSSFMIDITKLVNRGCGHRLFGELSMLSVTGGNIWRAKRRILDPAFKKSFLRNSMRGMNKVTRKLEKELENKTDGSVFDIMLDLTRSAMQAVSICGFDWNEEMVDKNQNNAMNMADLTMEIFAIAIKNSFQFSLPWSYQELKNRFKKITLSIRHIMKNHLENRLKNGNSGDILWHIIRTNDCSDELNIDDLIDEYISFLVAGMETTAITMATVVQFLSNNPVECQKVQEEVDEVFEGKEELEYEDITKLKYLECVIKETLRMRGPVFSIYKNCQNDNVTVDGVHFPKETKVIIGLDVIHNDARHWENPSFFNPGRFSGESGKNIQLFSLHFHTVLSWV